MNEKYNRLSKGDNIRCADEKDLHTYERCLKDAGIDYKVDRKRLTIRITNEKN